MKMADKSFLGIVSAICILAVLGAYCLKPKTGVELERSVELKRSVNEESRQASAEEPVAPYASQAALSKEPTFFIFTPYKSDPRERGHGTMHKVGLHESIATAFPQLVPASPKLLKANRARDVFVRENNYPPKLAFRYWLLIIDKAYVDHSGVLKIDVKGTTGSRACGNYCDARITETWRCINNELELETRTIQYPGFSSHTVGSRDGNWSGEANMLDFE